MSHVVEMIATCWTSAGDVAPLARPDERSPLDIEERIRAVAATGWRGIGIAQDDLAVVRDTIGFVALEQRIRDSGLVHTEIEFLNHWWGHGEERAASDRTRNLLLEAAEVLHPVHIKVGTSFSEALDSLEPLVEPLHLLAEQAADRGTRIALEPMPFSMVASVPLGAELVRAVDHRACGVIVDSWHVFRAGTSLEELERSLSSEIVFGAELDDADPEVVGSLFEDTITHRRLCGEGSFDLPGLVAVLGRVGFHGPWGVEIISDEHRSLPLEEALRRAFDTGIAAVRAGAGGSARP